MSAAKVNARCKFMLSCTTCVDTFLSAAFTPAARSPSLIGQWALFLSSI